MKSWDVLGSWHHSPARSHFPLFALQPLLEKLFAAFKFPESGENEYLMRAVMRVIAFVGASSLGECF